MTMPPQTTGSSGVLTPQQSATDLMFATLNAYGLGSLSDWAWQQLVAGNSEDYVMSVQLPQQPAFKQAFPEIDQRAQKGLPFMRPGDIINYRQAAQETMRAAGLPQGFWDQPSDFANLLDNGVSIDELRQRVDLAKQATFQVPQEVRDVLARDYGMTDGHLTAAFLDPTQAEPLAQKHFLAAQIGAQAQLAGYQTNRDQNERLADLGVSQAQAQQGFNQLAQSKELMGSLPGENTSGISQDDQLSAVFGGNADAQRKLQHRAQTREAVFNAGGQVAGNQAGYSGAGQAQGA